MLSKSSFFTTILLLLPALASAQTADDDLQLELRYYAPKLKFTSHGIVPAAYSNFRDTLNIKNGNAPEYRLSGKNWYVDYIAIHEKGYASHHIPTQGSLIPADSRTKLNLDYASFNYLSPIKTTENGTAYWLAGLRCYRFDTALQFSSPVLNKKYAKQLNQFAPAFGIGGKHYLDAAHQLQLYSELSGWYGGLSYSF